MSEPRDLSIPKNFITWALLGLTATISTVGSVVYFDMKKQRDECMEENKYYTRSSFDLVMENKTLKKTNAKQDTAIIRATSIIKDSVKIETK